MIRFLISFAALVLMATPAAGQDLLLDEQIRKVKTIRIEVSESGGDNCLPQPNVLEVDAQLILRRSGITVVHTNDQYPHYLVISPIEDFSTSEGCVAGLIISLQRVEELSDRTVGMVQAYFTKYILSDRKNRFQQRLREQVNETVMRLANEILKARQK